YVIYILFLFIFFIFFFSSRRRHTRCLSDWSSDVCSSDLDVQTFKAGVMEIADVFVINKADRPGADRVEQEVAAMLSIGPRTEAWRPPTLKTVATTAEGIGALREALDRFRVFGQSTALSVQRQQAKCRVRLLELLRQTWFEKVVAERLRDGAIDRYVDEVRAHRRDPHSVVVGISGESRRSKVEV